jgi:glutaryl-CoA dehydrogenase
MGFENRDFLNVDSLLSDEELAIRDATRDFVDDKILPVIEQHHRDGTFPNELIPEMAELGFLGSNIEGYGCAGINNVAYGLVMQELERADSGIRSFCSVQGALVMYPIYAFGSEDQKDKWLPKLASAEAIGCFGLTEADHGSDPGGMITRAEDKGDHWLLNGGKYWITNGCMSDVAVVWAKTELDEGQKGIRGFLVEKGMEGFSTVTIKNKCSLRASVTSELVFSDVKLPKENILPKTTGLKSALMCLTNARYGIAWGGVGSMLATYDEALRYSQTRKQFDRPIASFQLVQRNLAEMLTLLTHGQLTSLQMGRLKDKGELKHFQVSFGKRNNVAGARRCAQIGREILGAAGICDDYQAMRHMMNIESVYTYEGTHDIHTLILGHAITGIAAYS